MLSLLWLQGVIELAGGVLTILGLFTRPVAFVLAGNMAVAYFMSHALRSFSGAERRRFYDLVLLHLSVLRCGQGLG